MSKLAFRFVDVFGETRFAGNQLAVFLNAGALAGEEMQRIAREINFSETTFILSNEPHEGGYDVRIFTPREEVPFAGHPTLGTAFVVQREIIRQPVDRVILNLKVGPIPVTLSYQGSEVDLLWMRQNAPTFGVRLPPARVAPVLGLEEDEIDPRFPIEEVSTGLPALIVPLRTLESLKRIQVSREKYFALVGEIPAKAVLVFCPEPHRPGNDLSVRMFADYYGVPEDPATGSANGCLAAYLVRNRYYGQERIDVRVEQGYEMGRPSLLLLRAQEQGERIEVSVGGKVILVVEGTLFTGLGEQQ